MSRGTEVLIRPRALAHNAARAREAAGVSQVFAMVKANGYGHGLGLAARAMDDHVDGFGVAVLAEAVQLRHGGIHKPILLLQGVADVAELLEAQRLDLELVVHAPWQLALLLQHPPRKPVSVWLKVETGMHRLGVPLSDVARALETLARCPTVTVAGLMTHCACADQLDDPLSERQIERIHALAERHALPFSAANSAALLRYPASHGRRARPGIMLYGASPLAGQSAADLGLRPTQVFRARVLAINAVPAGDSVGYGATWTAAVDSQVAVVSVGYGDGYPRHAPSGTPVAIHGQRSPLVGRVSMDLVTVDITGREDVSVGDTVELWGDTVSVDEVAQACGTISYELFCQLTDRPVRGLDGEA